MNANALAADRASSLRLADLLRRELGLSRGAAHYRKVAARLVARFPEVVEPLHDGRLLISRASPVHPGELSRTRPEEPRTAVEPLTARRSRIHLTVSRELLSRLRKARAGQAHVMPGATDEQVIEAGLDLLLAQQEKRRASVPPKVKREVRTEIDHVVPRGRGGPSTVENCRVLCDVHNREAARHHRSPRPRGATSCPPGWTSEKRRSMLSAWPP